MKPTIIAFTGPQGSGKTTMMHELAKLLGKKHSVYEGYHMQNNVQNSSISRQAASMGFPINEKTRFETQYYIGLRYMAADLETRVVSRKSDVDFIIYDRAPLDVIPYTTVAEQTQIGENYKLMIKKMLLAHYDKFPVHFLIYCEPLKSIANDGLRSVDKLYQLRIVREFMDLYENIMFYQLPEDTLENRVKKVLEIIYPKPE